MVLDFYLCPYTILNMWCTSLTFHPIGSRPSLNLATISQPTIFFKFKIVLLLLNRKDLGTGKILDVFAVRRMIGFMEDLSKRIYQK